MLRFYISKHPVHIIRRQTFAILLHKFLSVFYPALSPPLFLFSVSPLLRSPWQRKLPFSMASLLSRVCWIYRWLVNCRAVLPRISGFRGINQRPCRLISRADSKRLRRLSRAIRWLLNDQLSRRSVDEAIRWSRGCFVNGGEACWVGYWGGRGPRVVLINRRRIADGL